MNARQQPGQLVLATALIAAIGCSLSASATAQAQRISLERMDANGNGQLEPGEIPSTLRPAVNRAAAAAGLNTAGPISIQRLRQAAARDGQSDGEERGRGGWSDRGRDDDRDDDRRDRGRRDRDDDRRDNDRYSPGDPAAVNSLVPGFVPEDGIPLVPGFGEDASAALRPIEEIYVDDITRQVDRQFRENDTNRNNFLDQPEWRYMRWSSEPSGSDTNGDGRLSRHEYAERLAQRWGARAYLANRSSDSDNRDSRDGDRDRERSWGRGGREERRDDDDESSEDRTRRYAQSLLRRYDRNGNGVLERDEWSQMGGEPAQSDSNRDGKITEEELTQRLANYGRRRSGDNGGSSSQQRPGASTLTAGQGSHRFLSPHERLPKGIPSWFTQYDADQDGQVAMAEYSASWSPEKIAEYEHFDVNRDGFITAAECVAAGEPLPGGDAKAASSGRSSGSTASVSGRPAMGGGRFGDSARDGGGGPPTTQDRSGDAAGGRGRFSGFSGRSDAGGRGRRGR